MPRSTVRPEAELDALEAASWYEGERADLGTEFLDELRTTFSRIEEGPQRFPVVFREVRRAILHRFPFGVFFIIESDSVIVLAITHLRRHPSAWQKRA